MSLIRRATEPIQAPEVHLVETNDKPLGFELVNKYRVNKVGEAGTLVELAEQIQQSGQFIRANATNKLQVIADQMKYLQQQALNVLEDAKRDTELSSAACNLKKKPGEIYYLYLRSSGQKYFSMLSPQEWGDSMPHEFLGAYRLEYDMSWTPYEEIAHKEEDLSAIDKLLATLNSNSSVRAITSESAK